MVHVTVPFADVPEPERAARMQHDIVNRMAVIPGVESVAFADIPPLGAANGGSDTVLMIDGKTYAPGQARPLRRFEFIAPAFFRTLGTPLIAGRDLSWVDLFDKRLVALVSENLAQEEWQSPAESRRSASASARRLTTRGAKSWAWLATYTITACICGLQPRCTFRH